MMILAIIMLLLNKNKIILSIVNIYDNLFCRDVYDVSGLYLSLFINLMISSIYYKCYKRF